MREILRVCGGPALGFDFGRGIKVPQRCTARRELNSRERANVQDGHFTFHRRCCRAGFAAHKAQGAGCAQSAWRLVTPILQRDLTACSLTTGLRRGCAGNLPRTESRPSGVRGALGQRDDGLASFAGTGVPSGARGRREGQCRPCAESDAPPKSRAMRRKGRVTTVAITPPIVRRISAMALSMRCSNHPGAPGGTWPSGFGRTRRNSAPAESSLEFGTSRARFTGTVACPPHRLPELPEPAAVRCVA